MGGAAVIEHDGGIGEQAADEEVPHHPAGRGEPEHAVAWAQVEVQPLLDLLDQDAAVALDDRLGQARGARGVEDPQGVVEGHLLKARARGGALGVRVEQLLPGDRSRAHGCRLCRRVQVGQQDGLLDGWELGQDSGGDSGAIEVLAAMAVAVDGQQDLGLDLGEAVDDAAGAELGGGARPDRAEAGGRQEGDQGLGDVGHVGDHPVPAHDSQRAQPGGRRGDLGPQLAPAQLGQLAGLRAVQDGRLLGVMPRDEVLGVVEPGALEPDGSRHLVRTQDTLVGRGGADATELPDIGPELLELGHRPLPQLAVVLEAQAVALRRPCHEACHLGLPQLLRRGRPDRLLGLGAAHADILADRGALRTESRVSRSGRAGPT